MKELFTLFISIGLVFIACKDKSKEPSGQDIDRKADSLLKKADSLLKVKDFGDSIQLAHRKDSILLKTTQNILTILKNKNYLAFANYIHPVEGLRFSPYGHIDTLRHIKLSRQKFIAQAAKSEQDIIVWGEFDGTGDPIKMTLHNYMQRFVYDVDFAKPENRTVNEFIGSGNSLNNLDSVYKNCDFTESHFSGFEKKYEGHDWRTLRLVFKERNGKYFLVAIVHDEWTI